MCTGVRFTSTDGQMYFGRNLDWCEEYGQKVTVAPKGYVAQYSFIPDEAAKHATIGTAIIVDAFPLYFDCGNDAGLACAGLNFPGFAQFEKDAVSDKTNIAAYEFPYWVCSTFSTVDQVEAALKDVAIVGKAPSGYEVALLHWVIGDAKRSIVVEYMPDGMHVFHDEVDVLTNQPTFDWHMQNLRNYMNCESRYVPEVTWDAHKIEPFGSGATMRGIPGDYASPSRFVKAAYLNANYPKKGSEAENVSRMFHTMSNVAMIDGAAQMGNGAYEITLYTGCFSAKTQNYYHSTYDDPTIRFARLSDHADAGAGALIQPELIAS